MRIVFFFFLIITLPGFSQSKYTLIKTIETTSDFFTTDNQGNVYAVKGNELSKFDKTGKLMYKYSNKNYGNISTVDASNMLRVLVFYKEFSVVFFLDNTLTQNGEAFNLLNKFNITQAPAVCASYDNSFWVFDQSKFTLIHADRYSNDFSETGNLNQLLTDSLQPTSMLEYDNKLYLNNPKSGILLFDRYGTYHKTIPIKNAEQFQPVADWVYYKSGKSIKAYNIKTTEEKEFEMPLTDFNSFRLETGIFMLRTPNSISLYSGN